MARTAVGVGIVRTSGVWPQPARAVLERGADGLAAELPVMRQRLAALDLALDAIAAPAVMLSRTGQILRANAVARGLLRPPKGGLRRALAAIVAAAIDGGVGDAAGQTGPGWNVTPLGSGHEPAGFLAILHGPPPPSAAAHPEALRFAGSLWKLTARQGEVLALVARGLTNELIGDTLGIGKGTVEFHLSAIFDKTGVSNRATLIVRAMEISRKR